MEEFVFHDTGNCERGGKKMNEEKHQKKKPNLGSAVRKGLSDITNTVNSPNQVRKPELISVSSQDHIEQLHKENMALMKLLAERNKLIELAGIELTKMRVNLQKTQQQNWQLAQANSNMLVELNRGKDRLKAMQHEIGCRNALLKSFELQERDDKKGPYEKAQTKEINATSNPIKRCQSTNQSPEFSAVTEQIPMKEKTNKRKSALFKSDQPEFIEGKVDNRTKFAKFKCDQPESTEEKVDNKRIVSRRQSARFKPPELQDATDGKSEEIRVPLRRHSARLKSKSLEPTEDLFKVDDAKFPVHPLPDDSMHETETTSSSTFKEEKDETSFSMNDTPDLRRSSTGRPTRRAAVKVKSYKEVPVNIKMRRPE